MKFLKPKNIRRGYSMVELLLVVSIIGVISALSYPVVRNFTSANAYAEARSKAEALTAAKALFYRTDPYAKSKWENAKADDSARFDLIRPFLNFDSAEVSLNEYAAASPYDTFLLGDDVRNAVSLAATSDNETPPDDSTDDSEEYGNGNSNGNANGNSNGNANGSSNGNNGHGNNIDGVDSSNPGQGQGGPNGQDDPSGDIDDEKSNGNAKSNGKSKK